MTIAFKSKEIISAKGKIEGASMYMGHIPLVFDTNEETGLVEAKTFLGACSDPDMRWQISIEYQTVSGKTVQWSSQFKSSPL
ncbi:hypothetical protein [Flocculibacter collagenilyticus]|uniref:hypothetical protein n=1 Tax=Flocculibacter collagenilyticus TaxID=2744479 RepID=UPI0018F3C3A9|nr:hypothetical protein [Flocculibacter collagenilyticus]